MKADENEKFMQQIRYVMSKCHWRRDMGGVGVCSLNILPCERVLYKGECEAVAEWYKDNKGGESNV